MRAAAIVAFAAVAASAHAQPSSVTIVGSLQSELGCPGDWDASCGATNLTYDAADALWQGSFPIPAGSYEYKVAIDGSLATNYGDFAVPNGANIPLLLVSPAMIKFYYDDTTHWVTDTQRSRIAVAPGSFQSELGCPGDWMPDCLRSWLEDIDGDGVYERTVTTLPAGAYESKVALDESWNENYGEGGLAGGANLAFTVTYDFEPVTFRFDAATHVPTVQVPEPGGALLALGALGAVRIARARRGERA
jgi:pullulanase-like protein